MFKLIKRGIEVYAYTRHIGNSIKIITLLWILPIMSRLICNKQITKLSHKLWEKRNKDMLFITPFGEFIANTINWRSVIAQEYEPSVRKRMLENYNRNRQEESRVFINIWCHIGRRLIEFVKNYWYQGIAFEASPKTFRYLQTNCLLSEIEHKVKLFNIWLSNKEEKQKFTYIPRHDWHSHILEDSELEQDNNQVSTITTKKFDDVELWINNKDIKLIMIDVEWHEYEVLQWMKETLGKVRKVDIFVEIFDDSKNKDNCFELMNELWFSREKITHADYIFHKD